MLRKKLKTISTIVIAMTIAYSTTTYAATNTAAAKLSKNVKGGIVSASGIKCKSHNKEEILKKLGITKVEFDTAQKAGKTLFDVAKTKGYSEADVKAIIIEVKSKAIDDKVNSGKITKEKGEALKAKIKDRVAKWDGNFKSHKKV